MLLGFENANDLGQGLEYARWRHFRYGTAMPMNDKDPIILTEEMYEKEHGETKEILHMLEKEGYCRVLDLHKAYFSKGPIFLYSGERLNFRDNGHITPAVGIEVMTQSSEVFVEMLKNGRVRTHQQAN